MTAQDPKKQVEIESPVYSPDNIPEDERTKHVGEQADDEAAKLESGESVELAADRRARPWRVAKSLLALKQQVNTRSPTRRKGSDGTIGDAAHASRSSDHNPWVIDGPNGVVTAMDITHDPARGCDAGQLANAIQASRDPRVKYIIWNRRIANSSAIGNAAAWSWRPYGGDNPHDVHVHISVKSDKPKYDSTATWTI